MITTLSLSPAVDKIYFADNFQAGGLYRVKNVIKTAGGKGINAARVASILGEKVCTVGFKAGETGNWLESELKKLGVDTRFVEIAGESRTNNNIIDRVNGTETEVLEMGPEVTDHELSRFTAELEHVLGGTTVLVCSGGLPVGVRDDCYRKLIEIAKARGIKTLLDTSGSILVEGVKAAPYMVKPNLRELSNYAGSPLHSMDAIVKACRRILSRSGSGAGLHGRRRCLAGLPSTGAACRGAGDKGSEHHRLR
jgi:1-phosphofructokinase/tagatose 6-phosphate kinase